MKHIRSDYDPIQDPRGLIPEDEPVFLIRAQDIVGPATLRVWADLHRIAGGDGDLSDAVCEQAFRMEAWQIDVAQKIADVPEGVLDF